MRVSNELGAGDAARARSAVAVSVGMGLMDGTVMASLIYSLRHKWGWAFTSDAEVVQDVARTAPYLAVIALLYVIGANLSGWPISSSIHRLHTKFLRTYKSGPDSCLFKAYEL